MNVIKLSEIPKYKKYQLADLIGYKIEEIGSRGRCVIIGADDNFIDNDFKNIDEVLLLIKRELIPKGFVIAA